MRDRYGRDVRVGGDYVREQIAWARVETIEQELDQREEAEGAVVVGIDCVEIGVQPRRRQLRSDGMHPVEESPVVSTGVPHNIEHLEPATQLRRTQRTSISDRLLHAKRSELEQAAEAAPIQQLDGRPHGNLPAVLLLVVSNEVLSRAAKRFVRQIPARGRRVQTQLPLGCGESSGQDALGKGGNAEHSIIRDIFDAGG